MFTFSSSRSRRRHFDSAARVAFAEPHDTSEDLSVWLSAVYACGAYGLAWCLIPPWLFPTARNAYVDR
jgi:hypothetical protein